MNITAILDRPIAFYRSLVSATNSVLGGLLLSQAIYWQNRATQEDGWWWKTMEEWTEETGMTRTEFESARRSCKSFLKVRRKGIPAKCWYKVDDESLTAFFSNQDCRNPANCNAGNQQTGLQDNSNLLYTETTSKTTSETGARTQSFPVGSSKNPKPSKEQLTERFKLLSDKVPDEFKNRWNPSEEAEKFIAHFESNGWKIGGKSKMLSWEATTTTWVIRFADEQKRETRRSLQAPPDKILAALDDAIANHICNPKHPRHHLAKQKGEITDQHRRGYAELTDKLKRQKDKIIASV